MPTRPTGPNGHPRPRRAQAGWPPPGAAAARWSAGGWRMWSGGPRLSRGWTPSPHPSNLRCLVLLHCRQPTTPTNRTAWCTWLLHLQIVAERAGWADRLGAVEAELALRKSDATIAKDIAAVRDEATGQMVVAHRTQCRRTPAFCCLICPLIVRLPSGHQCTL